MMMLGLFTAQAKADDTLTGDTRLACEAILCLSTGSTPHECSPSLNRYFSINKKKFKNTIKARHNFLKMCPTSNQTPEMQSLVNDLANGAGRCDVDSLNRFNKQRIQSGNGSYTVINDRMPTYCNSYVNNQYVDFGDVTPRYVGLPENGGYWVEESDYPSSLADYNAKIAQQELARQEAAMYDANDGR